MPPDQMPPADPPARETPPEPPSPEETTTVVFDAELREYNATIERLTADLSAARARIAVVEGERDEARALLAKVDNALTWLCVAAASACDDIEPEDERGRHLLSELRVYEQRGSAALSRALASVVHPTPAATDAEAGSGVDFDAELAYLRGTGPDPWPAAPAADATREVIVWRCDECRDEIQQNCEPLSGGCLWPSSGGRHAWIRMVDTAPATPSPEDTTR